MLIPNNKQHKLNIGDDVADKLAKKKIKKRIKGYYIVVGRKEVTVI